MIKSKLDKTKPGIERNQDHQTEDLFDQYEKIVNEYFSNRGLEFSSHQNHLNPMQSAHDNAQIRYQIFLIFVVGPNCCAQIRIKENPEKFKEQIPKQHQKSTISIFDKAKEIQISLQNQMDIFICQIQKLEDQYYMIEEESSDPYHPNILAEKCLEKIKETDYFLQKTIKKIERALGNTIKIKFYINNEVQSLPKFESLELLEYKKYTQIFYDSVIVAYDFSYQDKLLACCYDNIISISDLQSIYQNNEIIHKRSITAIKYYNDDSFSLVVGDIDGFIAKYTTEQSQFSYQLHNLAICQILIKNSQIIFTCSLDNTIKQTNIEQFEIILSINNSCSCFSGFDFSYQKNFLIAPNNFSYLSIWDGSSGQEITTKSLDFEEDQFIAIQLSSDSKQVLVNLFKLYTILLFQIKYDLKELVQIKQIKLHNSVEKCVNFQWCLGDTSFIYFHQSSFDIRNLERKNIPLIFEQVIKSSEDYLFQRGFVNKLNKDLNYLVAIFHHQVQIYKKRKQR